MNCGHPGAFPNGDLFFRSAENTTVGSYIEFKYADTNVNKMNVIKIFRNIKTHFDYKNRKTFVGPNVEYKM